MALFRNVGQNANIAPGVTHSWDFTFGGADVGVVMFTPNLKEPQINTELVVVDTGVFLVPSGGAGGPLTHYSVRIHNNGSTWMTYNLNIGNLL